MSKQNTDQVRQEAFRAAAAAVDRFIDRVADPMSETFDDFSAAATDRFRSELARVVDLNLEMVRNAFGLYGRFIGPESFQSDAAVGPLAFSTAVPGSEAMTVLWLHNFDDDPMTDVDLVGSKLSAAARAPIEHPGWSFSPSTVSVPPRSAVPVLVEVAIPPGVAGGTYEGTISAGGRHGPPIEVQVEVVAMEPVPHDSW